MVNDLITLLVYDVSTLDLASRDVQDGLLHVGEV